MVVDETLITAVEAGEWETVKNIIGVNMDVLFEV